MQIKHILSNPNSVFYTLLKLGILVASLWYLTDKLYAQAKGINAFEWHPNFIIGLLVCFVLMFINWALEGYRWQISVKGFYSITFWESLRTVLTGLAFNTLIPFTAGDAMARIYSIHNKKAASAAVLINRSIMLMLTLVYGLFSIYHRWGFDAMKSHPAWSLLVIVPILFVLLRYSGRLGAYFQGFDLKSLWRIAGISILRYFVFVLQFFIMLKLFTPSLPNEALFWGIGWVFLARSILPSIMGGLGIREASGLLFFSTPTVVLPIAAVWIINTLIPTVVGLACMWKFKFKIVRWSFLSRG